MDDVDAAIEEIEEFIDDIICDTRRFTMAQSLMICEDIKRHCATWAVSIKKDME